MFTHRRTPICPTRWTTRPARTALLAVGCLMSLAMMVGAGPALAASPEEERLAQALRQGGVVVLIRHAATHPGVGDPPGFVLADCSTQRNLSEGGRDQARRMGQWFAVHGIRPKSVRVSPWCRTRETATLAFGRSADWVPLSNLLHGRGNQAEHAAQVDAAIRHVQAGAVDVMVSHGVTISAFVGVYLQQGEMVAVRPIPGTDSTAGKPTVEVIGQLLVP